MFVTKSYSDKVVIFDGEYTKVKRGDRFEDPNTLYLFSDNVARAWCGGQALIRHAYNSQGIITKMLPKRTNLAYLTDETFFANSVIINSDITHACKRIDDGEFVAIAIPKGGFGTGLAELKTNAPKTFNHLSAKLKDIFGYDNPGWDGGRP